MTSAWSASSPSATWRRPPTTARAAKPSVAFRSHRTRIARRPRAVEPGSLDAQIGLANAFVAEQAGGAAREHHVASLDDVPARGALERRLDILLDDEDR